MYPHVAAQKNIQTLFREDFHAQIDSGEYADLNITKSVTIEAVPGMPYQSPQLKPTIKLLQLLFIFHTLNSSQARRFSLLLRVIF